MRPSIRTLPILILSLLLLAMLSGCSWFGDKKKTADKRFDRYEPMVVSSSAGTIEVKFLDVNSYAQPEQALELIREHCQGAYTESNRQTVTGWTTIKADCG